MNAIDLKILFLINRTKLNRQGKAPIRCRITLSGVRKIFSTGLFVNPNHWKNGQQKAHPPNDENNYINTQLSLIKNEISQAFLYLQVNSLNFDVNDIYLKYKGENIKAEKTLLEAFEIHNNKMEKLIGIEYAQLSWSRYNLTKNHIAEFLKLQLKKNDYLLKDLNENFLQEFEYFLKTEKKFQASTTFKSLQRTKKVVKMAVSMGFLDKDPFLLHRLARPKKEVVYLTAEELERLENHNFPITRVEQIRDFFVFCCYTGLAFTEMYNLEKKHIVTGFDGNQWIQMQRKKTQKQISIPLLPKALSIIEKYQEYDDVRVLPKASNSKFNSYLKEIAGIVGIEKNLTHHIARKTFATTVLLYNDVPMEIVSELLGHSKITITQEHYGKVVQKKVSEHIRNLSKKLDKK
ncbi:site-specific integrase [Moheibacter sediminis]|uniref:Site-specific recombinase XerD n=1 Tax=Moheibacter sediminis TaxID=1434700 RepID=A0A1W2C7P1_9FLAO|nr:site-specific integrase [Moheibacter sediminis]SMC81285.1 Site-specific recombinase XerD [Moheibacter sediminis]